MQPTLGILFDVDPLIFESGPIEISWYGLFFGGMLWAGFGLLYHATKRAGYSIALIQRYLPWAIIGLVVGARLGHCLFYESERYLAQPLELLKVWKGGLSSHGGTAGILGSLYLFCRYHGLRYVDLVDRMTLPAAAAAMLVRLGNLMNSEIVGARTTLPWGFKFPRYDCRQLDLCVVLKRENYLTDPYWTELVEAVPTRHPIQIYEFIIGAFVFATLVILDRRQRREHRPLGLLTGAFGIAYFGLRFLVEFVKEPQALGEEAVLTMGQYMSIPPVLVGVYLLIRAFRHPEPADSLQIPARFSDRGPVAADRPDDSNDR